MVTTSTIVPARVPNWIGHRESDARGAETFEKKSPCDGRVLWQAARSRAADVNAAVEAAVAAQPGWAETPGVERGMTLLKLVKALEGRQSDMARVVADETGKSHKDAMGETAGAIALGLFFASEGQRLYGRTTTSGVRHRMAMTIRQPVGVAGLIVPANTPIANLAWKIFPALVCGNTAVVKAAEDTPGTAWLFGKLAKEAGLPDGILSIVQGLGAEAGEALVAHPGVGVISFTGSTRTGKNIQRVAGERLARVSLELGGKNPFVVCDDADLAKAVQWATLSAFSNAGQRCASGSRIIVVDAVYESFKAAFVERAKALKVGPGDSDDFGPVINERQLANMLAAVEGARPRGARILAGGARLTGDAHKGGCYMAATVLEGVGPDDPLSVEEVFGPITCLYRVKDFREALALANRSPYGLTACIHTRDVNRAQVFIDKVQAGVVSVNGGTYGSESHMPFGGVKQSGNGTREPGSEALDVYSSLKDVYINTDPSAT